MQFLVSYLLFFLGIVLEGEMVLISAAIAAHQRYMNLYAVIGIAIGGTLLSDFTYFYLGRNRGIQWLKHKKMGDKLDKVNAKLEKHRGILMTTYRFIYGARMLVPFAIGLQGISYRKFFVYCLTATIVWCALFVGLGYTIGEVVIEQLKRYQKIEYIFIGLLFGLGMVFGIHWYLKTYKKE